MLSRFCNVTVSELLDEPLTHVKSEKEEEAVRQAEGRRILEKCSGYVVACAISGKQFSSEAFAQTLAGVMNGGKSTVTFVIGGSVGLAREVLDRADLLLSFSEMTMPHRLFRIVLLEQVYRAFKIINKETYHK